MPTYPISPRFSIPHATLALAVAALFALFHSLASWLGSDRGQHGLLIAAAVVLATATAECLLFKTSPRDVLIRLGFGRPDGRGTVAAVVACSALFAVFPIYAFFAGTGFGMYAGWPWLAVGIFAQGGIAEETLFRGFLYRHYRETRPFLRATMLAAMPFVAVHLYLFATLPAAIATASVGLSVVTAFPLAWLFDRGGRTIWAPALLHAVVQGAVKLIVIDEPDSTFPLVWIGCAAVVPFVAFLWRPTGVTP